MVGLACPWVVQQAVFSHGGMEMDPPLFQEAIRWKALLGLERRRSRQFEGMRGAVDRTGVRASMDGLQDATIKGYLHGIVTVALWMA